MLKPATLVDLHIHTTASDGSWTPLELISRIQETGIGLFSVTDHDSVANIAVTARLAKAAGLVFIPGVEICSTIHGQNIHILGYGIDAQSKPLNQLLNHNTELMEAADTESICQLIDQGLPIDYAEYQAFTHDPARGGWKSLSYLIDKGLCANVKEFFGQLFTEKRGIRFPEFPPPQEVIATIHAAGGKAVLAHPGSDFHGTTLEETLDYFDGEAIDGVECFHPSHDKATSLQAISWCERHGRLITGGSDCHGTFVSERRLGSPPIRLDQLQLAALLTAM